RGRLLGPLPGRPRPAVRPGLLRPAAVDRPRLVLPAVVLRPARQPAGLAVRPAGLRAVLLRRLLRRRLPPAGLRAVVRLGAPARRPAVRLRALGPPGRPGLVPRPGGGLPRPRAGRPAPAAADAGRAEHPDPAQHVRPQPGERQPERLQL